MPSVGINRGGGRGKGGGEAVSRMQCKPGADVGEKGKTERRLLDVFSDGLHLKKRSLHLLLTLPPQNPHIPLFSLCVCLCRFRPQPLFQGKGCNNPQNVVFLETDRT